MIKLYTGTPGAGKSYGSLKREIIPELRWGDRVVVTNLAIRPGELNAYLQSVGADCDLDDRLRMISRDEAQRFWLCREAGVKIPDTVDPDFGVYSKRPILYVIDEAHIMFDARHFMEISKALSFYISQHRHLDDEIVFISQHGDQLEKRIRKLAGIWYVFRNLGYQNMWQFFRMPKRMIVRTYYSEPPAVCDKIEYEKLDLAVAGCYDTTGGVGISGKRKPERFKAKGFPLWTLVFPGLVALVALTLGPEWLMGKVFGRVDAAAKRAGGVPVAANGPRMAPVAPAGASRVVAEVVKPLVAPRRLRGFAQRGWRVNVFLSDGTRLTEDDGGFVSRGRRFRTWGGEVMDLDETVQAFVAPIAVAPVAVDAIQKLSDDNGDRGEWHRDADGVSRLKTPPHLDALGLR